MLPRLPRPHEVDAVERDDHLAVSIGELGEGAAVVRGADDAAVGQLGLLVGSGEASF